MSVMMLLLVTLSSIAQTTNDPNNDPEANACYAGGTLYSTCNSTDADHDGDIDQQDVDWMWKCGYYLIRVEHGIYSTDILDGICMEIIAEVEVEVEVKEKKTKKVEIIEESEEPECGPSERSIESRIIECPE